jgi:hypothetical protein
VKDLGFELVCERCLATRGVLDSDSYPDVCPECGARDAWKGPFATTHYVREVGDAIAASPFYLAVTGSRVGADVVYAVCTDCTYLGAYGSAAQFRVPDSCPVCGGDLVVPNREQRYPLTYVNRVSLNLLDTPAL